MGFVLQHLCGCGQNLLVVRGRPSRAEALGSAAAAAAAALGARVVVAGPHGGPVCPACGAVCGGAALVPASAAG